MQATIKLGERDYVIQEAKRHTQAEWRKRFEDAFEGVSELVIHILQKVDGDIPGLTKSGEQGDEQGEITPEQEQENMATAKGFLIKLLGQANALVSGVLDEALELVVSYSPLLMKDKDYILSDALDSQIIDALVEVVKLAYPFGTLIVQLQKMGRLPGTSSVKSKT